MEPTHKQLEGRHVREVYEEIATHFSQTRYKAWPVVHNFLLNLPAGSVGLDVGCGNGKNMLVRNKDIVIMGLDLTPELLRICQRHGLETIRGSMISLPFRDRSQNFIICIAALHHLASPGRRLQALVEMGRVLDVGGVLLIFVWAFEQPSDSYVYRSGLEFLSEDHQDVLVPWSTDGVVHKRYYHLFKQGELEALVRETDLFVLEYHAGILSAYYSQQRDEIKPYLRAAALKDTFFLAIPGLLKAKHFSLRRSGLPLWKVLNRWKQGICYNLPDPMQFLVMFVILIITLCLQVLEASKLKYILEVLDADGTPPKDCQKLIICDRFGKLLLGGCGKARYLAKSEIIGVDPPNKRPNKSSYCTSNPARRPYSVDTTIRVKSGASIDLECAMKEPIERLFAGLKDIVDGLDEEALSIQRQDIQTTDSTTFRKEQILTTAALPQLVTGMSQKACYTPKKLYLEFRAGSKSLPRAYLINDREKLRLRLGALEYASMETRTSLLEICRAAEANDPLRLSILWPQDQESAASLRLDNFAYTAPEQRPMFHVLYSGDFREQSEEALIQGHPSTSILGPFAHVYTVLRMKEMASTINEHFPSATYDDGGSFVYLQPRDFGNSSPTLSVLLEEAKKGERLTILKSKPYFRTCGVGTFQYQEPSKKYYVSMVFGSGLEVDLRASVRKIQRKRAELLQLMANEYKHAILAALMSEAEIQALYLQPLVHPNDRYLFRLSLVALGKVVTEISTFYRLIPIKVILPLLSPRAYHSGYEMEMIQTLEKHVPPSFTLTVEKISFSKEKGAPTFRITESSPSNPSRTVESKSNI